jgi:hypothetical protein
MPGTGLGIARQFALLWRELEDDSAAVWWAGAQVTTELRGAVQVALIVHG